MNNDIKNECKKFVSDFVNIYVASWGSIHNTSFSS
jgi:hypothetical protein